MLKWRDKYCISRGRSQTGNAFDIGANRRGCGCKADCKIHLKHAAESPEHPATTCARRAEDRATRPRQGATCPVTTNAGGRALRGPLTPHLPAWAPINQQGGI